MKPNYNLIRITLNEKIEFVVVELVDTKKKISKFIKEGFYTDFNNRYVNNFGEYIDMLKVANNIDKAITEDF